VILVTAKIYSNSAANLAAVWLTNNPFYVEEFNSLTYESFTVAKLDSFYLLYDSIIASYWVIISSNDGISMSWTIEGRFDSRSFSVEDK